MVSLTNHDAKVVKKFEFANFLSIFFKKFFTIFKSLANSFSLFADAKIKQTFQIKKFFLLANVDFFVIREKNI